MAHASHHILDGSTAGDKLAIATFDEQLRPDGPSAMEAAPAAAIDTELCTVCGCKDYVETFLHKLVLMEKRIQPECRASSATTAPRAAAASMEAPGSGSAVPGLADTTCLLPAAPVACGAVAELELDSTTCTINPAQTSNTPEAGPRRANSAHGCCVVQ